MWSQNFSSHPLLDQFEEELRQINSLESLEHLRVRYIGKSGLLTLQLKEVGKKPAEERHQIGQLLNHLKQQMGVRLEAEKRHLEDILFQERLAGERVDITLPSLNEEKGRIHPLRYVMQEIEQLFKGMGFYLASGPDIEDEDLNFTQLNIPPLHPARSAHDTFYIQQENASPGHRVLLRTHTTPVALRALQRQGAPLRMIALGTVYRSDSDATHTPMFHQLEGWVIEKGVHMGHLKGCLTSFLKIFLGVPDLQVRFRPHFFPFTEPSVEVDIGCKRERGQIKVGNYGEWMEILGGGMVHPQVLQNCGIDPEHYQGFAFGMGLDRLTMLKYGIPDLRPFYESDIRWLKHFGFKPENVGIGA